MIVIPSIGNNDNGSFQPINIEAGSRTNREIISPFRTGLIFKVLVDIKNPVTTHIRKAEIFASHGNFWISIGITSIIPATIPDNSPVLILFINNYF